MKNEDLKHLIKMMDTSSINSIKAHPKSIMNYGKICDHDDGFLCDHRRDVIINFIRLKTNTMKTRLKEITLTRSSLNKHKKRCPIDQISIYDFDTNHITMSEIDGCDRLVFEDDLGSKKILKQTEIMATTEQEAKLEVGPITAQLFAEYENEKCRDIYATIDCDGWVVTWCNIRHRHGQILLWDGKFTADWKVAVDLLDKDFMLKLRKEIDKLTETI